VWTNTLANMTLWMRGFGHHDLVVMGSYLSWLLKYAAICFGYWSGLFVLTTEWTASVLTTVMDCFSLGN
jgi:hypothetical protein